MPSHLLFINQVRTAARENTNMPNSAFTQGARVDQNRHQHRLHKQRQRGRTISSESPAMYLNPRPVGPPYIAPRPNRCALNRKRTTTATYFKYTESRKTMLQTENEQAQADGEQNALQRDFMNGACMERGRLQNFTGTITELRVSTWNNTSTRWPGGRSSITAGVLNRAGDRETG